MKKLFTVRIILLISIPFLLTSCATIFSGFKQKITVISDPDSAEIYLNGQNTSLLTPSAVKVPRRLPPSLNNKKNEPYFLLKKEGYEDYEVRSSKMINPVVFANPLIGALSYPIVASMNLNSDSWYPIIGVGSMVTGFVVDLISGSTIRYDKRVFARMKQKPYYTRPVFTGKVDEVTSGGGLALCIGNGNYLHGGTLSNPENDATDMAEALKSLGYKVVLYTNIGQNEMKRAIDEFGNELKNFKVGLFFYAGHGIQAKGANYLIPVDASISSESDVEYNCVDAGRVLGRMEGAGCKTNIIILDACRNNPFERSWTRSANGKGLAVMDAPIGSLIGFATSPGSTASDGSGRNGLYTSAILKNISEPGITIIELFQRVRKMVREYSTNQQVPWESTSLEGNYYFKK
jgi:hypothetical protein